MWGLLYGVRLFARANPAVVAKVVKRGGGALSLAGLGAPLLPRLTGESLIMKLATLSTMLLLGFFLSPQAQAQCSNINLNGVLFYTLSGTIKVGPSSVSYQEQGKVTADGNGNLSGTSTTSIAGVLATLPVTGATALVTGAARGLGWEAKAPSAEVVGGGGIGDAVEVDGDLLAGRGVAPDVDGHVALEDHVAGEDFGEGDFGSGGEGEAEQGEGVEQLHG